MNRPAPQTPPTIPPPTELLGINTNPPSRIEISRAIKSLKTGKAAGPDGIPPEALKADTQTSTEMLYPLLNKVWEQEQVPEDWKKGHMVKLPKRGDMSSCNNWRGIMLLSIPGKVLTRIILERRKTALDKKLRDEQAGFRQNRSCTDHIATMRIIIEQSLEWQSPLYSVFVDFQKAFDSIDRETIWKLMQHYGSPPKFITIIQLTYLTLPLFLVGHDVGYYGPPFFPVGSNFCASVYVHSCISGDVSQPSASFPSSTAFAIYHAFCDYTL